MPRGFHKLHFKCGNIYDGVFIQYVYIVVCCYTVVFLWSCSCVMRWCHEWTVFSSFKLRGINDIKIMGQCFPVRPLKDNERKSLLADQDNRRLQELTFTRQRWGSVSLVVTLDGVLQFRRHEYVTCPLELLHCRRNVKGTRNNALESQEYAYYYYYLSYGCILLITVCRFQRPRGLKV